MHTGQTYLLGAKRAYRFNDLIPGCDDLGIDLHHLQYSLDCFLTQWTTFPDVGSYRYGDDDSLLIICDFDNSENWARRLVALDEFVSGDRLLKSLPNRLRVVLSCRAPSFVMNCCSSSSCYCCCCFLLVATGLAVSGYFWSFSPDPLAPLVASTVFVTTALFGLGTTKLCDCDSDVDDDWTPAQEREFREWVHDIRSRDIHRLRCVSDEALRWEFTKMQFDNDD